MYTLGRYSAASGCEQRTSV